MSAPVPFALLAELTHRCPLACPYCSNPLELDRKADELPTADWVRVFEQAAETRHPATASVGRRARDPPRPRRTRRGRCPARPLLQPDHLGNRPRRGEARSTGGGWTRPSPAFDSGHAADAADRIAGLSGSHQRKRAFAAKVVAAGLPLTINAVLHRGNLARMAAMVDEAIAMGRAADRTRPCAILRLGPPATARP